LLVAVAVLEQLAITLLLQLVEMVVAVLLHLFLVQQ
jgi:hypothetical protein